MINVLRRLAEVSALQPGVTGVPPEHLTRRAYPLAQELYPELMAKRVNTMPLRRLWIPLLDRKYGWIPGLMVLLGMGLFVLGSYSLSLGATHPQFYGDGTGLLQRMMLGARWYFLKALNRAAWLTPSSWPFLVKIGWMNLMFVLAFFPPATLALIFWFFHGIRGWFGEREAAANPAQTARGTLLTPGWRGPRQHRALLP